MTHAPDLTCRLLRNTYKQHPCDQAFKAFQFTPTERTRYPHSNMETVKNVVASVNEGVASVAKSAQEALGTVHDKVGCACMLVTLPARSLVALRSQNPLCHHTKPTSSGCSLQAAESAHTGPQKVDEVSCSVDTCLPTRGWCLCLESL